MKNNLRAILAALLAAATLTGSGCVHIPADDRPDAPPTDTYIIEWNEADSDMTDTVLAAIAEADPDYELLYSYANIMEGVAVRTTAEGAESADALRDVNCVNAGKMAVTDYESSMFSVSNMLSVSAGYESGFRGEGMTVAVIDASFDPYHELFVLSDDSTAKFDKTYVDNMVKKGLSATKYFVDHPGTSPYLNAKIPFAFDYYSEDTDLSDANSHGTHVAGSIGANKLGNPENGFDGIAPEAQLILMKVAPDNSGAIDDAALFAALDDALSLGVDAINMSFGVAAGYANMSSSSTYFYNLFSYAERKGIDIFCAAGNDGMFGGGGRYADGQMYPSTLNPDYGLISEPASFHNAIAVGSNENEITYVRDYIETDDGDIILYNESSENNFTSTFAGQTLSYVMLPGLGYDQDYNGLDVQGKLVVIERGVLPYSEKAAVAKRNGAAGIIVYNSEDADEEEQFIMDMQGEKLPAVFVRREDGLNLQEGNRLTVHAGDLTAYVTANGGALSDFTSWGPTADLKLKPDLTAPGGNIWSTYKDNGYQSLSGTSMATPSAAGMSLLLRQYQRQLLNDPNTPSRSTVNGKYFIRQLMMTSAIPIVNSANRVEFSPRAQGAGVIDMESALHSRVLITDESGEYAKLELGDGLSSRFAITFRVKNFSAHETSYHLSATLTADGYATDENGGTTVTGSAAAFTGADIRYTLPDGTQSGNLNRHHSSFDGGSLITLAPGEERTVTLQVNCDDGAFKRYEEVFQNGFYLEGYLYLTPVIGEDGAPIATASVPYMGFCGDFAAVPIFEDSFGGSHSHRSRIISYMDMDGTDMQYALGTNIFGENTNAFDKSLVALSPNKDGNGESVGILLSPLRNIRSFHVEIKDANGDPVYFSDGTGSLKKAYALGSGLYNTAGVHYIWDCSDLYNPKYTLPDGSYTFELIATTDRTSDVTQTLSFDFYIDTVSPTVEKTVLKKRGGRTYLEITAADDRNIQAGMLYALAPATDGGEAGHSYSALEAVEIEDVSDRHVFSFDITGHTDTDVFYFDLVDYACNIITVRIPMADLT